METMNEKYVKRKLVHYTPEEYLSLDNTDTKNAAVNIIDPTNGELKYCIDIGEFLYEEKIFVSSHKKNESYYKVNPNTLVKHWEPFIYKLNEHAALKRTTTRSKAGIYHVARRALVLVSEVGVADEFLRSKEDTKSAYRKVTLELKHRMQVGDITPRKADILQTYVASVSEIYFGRNFRNHIVADNINLKGSVETTFPREIDELKYAYDVYHSIATQLTDYLVNEKPLPFLLKIQNYETYLFPYANHRVTPYCNRPTKAYNDIEGRLTTFEELRAKTDSRTKDSIVRADLVCITKRFNESDLNPRAKCKRAFATTAMQSYQMIFMMLTGAYVSEINQLEFCDNYEYCKSVVSKSYRAIKFRASGRVVQYDLSVGGVKLFKKYLELRKWVLDGKKCDLLFFGLINKSWGTTKVTGGSMRHFQKRKIIGVFLPQDFKALTSREFRKTKSVFLHEQSDITTDTVSNVLNHSKSTNQNHYMEVSPEKIKTEMESFWESTQEAVKHVKGVTKKAGAHYKKVAAGHCDGFEEPISVMEAPPIQPDCRSQYGCLFCVHYVCHANDEEDAHKLTSLLYIVTGVINASKDESKAIELFKLLAGRTRKMLYHMKGKSKDGKRNVDACMDKVFKYGELTPYWESRLQRYENLGLIFTESDGLETSE
ncbi:hypothetical protein F0248_22300 [Vibrio crassostreae]|uniref:hypothetical protein n=1 Tax=Vibrio crassostreae TaxID=246167 RepID=UPI00148E8341|nr:hypothetical protein [Vibrio crassostreae]NOI55760.1 hypothetical protein [Vibrio crassostreae]